MEIDLNMLIYINLAALKLEAEKPIIDRNEQIRYL
jgi:hypothetical protein